MYILNDFDYAAYLENSFIAEYSAVFGIFSPFSTVFVINGYVYMNYCKLCATYIIAKLKVTYSTPISLHIVQ